MKKILITFLFVLAFSISLPQKASAARNWEKCVPTSGSGWTGIDTAIGCIPVLNKDTGASFMTFVLRWAIGIGGGIAFLLILYAGFMLMTSAGNPERIKAGQELLTSALSGLILLIFSIFILNFVGIKILGIFN